MTSTTVSGRMARVGMEERLRGTALDIIEKIFPPSHNVTGCSVQNVQYTELEVQISVFCSLFLSSW